MLGKVVKLGKLTLEGEIRDAACKGECLEMKMCLWGTLLCSVSEITTQMTSGGRRTESAKVSIRPREDYITYRHLNQKNFDHKFETQSPGSEAWCFVLLREIHFHAQTCPKR